GASEREPSWWLLAAARPSRDGRLPWGEDESLRPHLEARVRPQLTDPIHGARDLLPEVGATAGGVGNLRAELPLGLVPRKSEVGPSHSELLQRRPEVDIDGAWPTQCPDDAEIHRNRISRHLLEEELRQLQVRVGERELIWVWSHPEVHRVEHPDVPHRGAVHARTLRLRFVDPLHGDRGRRQATPLLVHD